MKDFIKQELHVGDRVVHGVGGRGGGLSGPYFIVGLTPKMVKVARSAGTLSPYAKTVNPDCLVKVADV